MDDVVILDDETPPTKPFPLMELPGLAIGEVLSHFDPIKKIEASKLSKQFASVIRFSGTARDELTLDFRTGKIIIKSRGVTYELFVLETLGPRIRVNRITPEGRQRMYLNYDNSGDEWMNIGFYIATTFNCTFRGFHTGHRSLTHEKFQRIINRIIRRQSEIAELSLFMDSLSGEELRSILDRIKVTEDLFINIRRVPQLEYKFLYSPKIVRIVNSSWFTLKNLHEMRDAEVIKWENSTLKNADLNEFLNMLKAGGFPKLQYFEVSGDRLNLRTPIATRTPPIVGMGRLTIIISPYRLSIVNGVPIQQSIGKRALIKLVNTNATITFSMMPNLTPSVDIFGSTILQSL